VRAAFASLAVRPEVPIEEQLGLLPFRLSEMAGFKIGGVLPGRGVLLTDVAADAASKVIEPHIIVALMPGAPAEAGDRDDIARQIFRSIPNLKDVRITGSEQLRIGGQQGHEIMASAKDPGTGADISLVQCALVAAPICIWSEWRRRRDGRRPMRAFARCATASNRVS